MGTDVFAQNGARCRLEWGRRGARVAGERGDIVIVVDTLSFSTAAATAIHYGGFLHPCSTETEAAQIGRDLGAVVAVHRKDVPARGRFSLSPLTFVEMNPGVHIALPSPNGATLCRLVEPRSPLLVGALINAQAVARAATHLLQTHTGGITVVAAGERWTTPSEDGDLRFAIEDYLGAGAILAELPAELSPEGQLCAQAFRSVQERLFDLLWECGSGRELRERGYGDDVRHAAQWNRYDSTPIRQGNHLERLDVSLS